MHTQLKHSPDHRTSIASARERLQAQYSRHRNSADFWDAYQAIQSELAATFPDERVEVCNLMAHIAERLGAVDHAQLICGSGARNG